MGSTSSARRLRPTASKGLAWPNQAGAVAAGGDPKRVKAELIRDVASQRTAVPVVRTEVVAVLDAWTAAHGGELLLVLGTAGRSAQASACGSVRLQVRSGIAGLLEQFCSKVLQILAVLRSKRLAPHSIATLLHNATLEVVS